MAMDFASIISQEYFETMQKKGTPNTADVYPIGTGPFEFVSYQKDAIIRYKASTSTGADDRRSITWSIPSPATRLRVTPS